MKTNIALLIEQSVNVIDSLNKGLRLTPEEQQFFCEHFEREEIKKNEFEKTTSKKIIRYKV